MEIPVHYKISGFYFKFKCQTHHIQNCFDSSAPPSRTNVKIIPPPTLLQCLVCLIGAEDAGRTRSFLLLRARSPLCLIPLEDQVIEISISIRQITEEDIIPWLNVLKDHVLPNNAIMNNKVTNKILFVEQAKKYLKYKKEKTELEISHNVVIMFNGELITH